MACWLNWYSTGFENRHSERISGFESQARRKQKKHMHHDIPFFTLSKSAAVEQLVAPPVPKTGVLTDMQADSCLRRPMQMWQSLAECNSLLRSLARKWATRVQISPSASLFRSSHTEDFFFTEISPRKRKIFIKEVKYYAFLTAYRYRKEI